MSIDAKGCTCYREHAADTRRAAAFLLGLREFRRDLTTHFDWPAISAYDKARDLAHRLTLRHWDHP